MKKKSIYLLVIIVAAMLLLMLGATKVEAAAGLEDATTYGDYKYFFVSNTSEVFGSIEEIEEEGLKVEYAMVASYIGNDSNVVVPDTILGYEIRQIEDFEAFRGCTTIKSITLPSTIDYIGDYAFADCTNLTSINIPNSLTILSSNTFEGCTSLKNITIPKSVTSIGEDVFKGCTNLTITCAPESRALQYAFNNNINYKLTSKVNIKSNKNMEYYVNTDDKSYSGKSKKTYIYLDYGFGLDNPYYDKYTYGWYDLKEGTDYTVSYSNNKNIGKATVTITGKGNYTGTITKTFNIVPKNTTISKVTNVKNKSAKVTWKKDSSVDGYEIYMSTAKKDSKNMRTKSKITIRKSTNAKSKKVINVAKGKKVQILKKKKVKGVTWYKVKYNGKTGYVQSKYLEPLYNEGKYSKIKTVKTNSTTSYTKKKLSKGKRYTFKIRSYKIVNGQKYYSSYSKVKWVYVKN